MTLALAWIRKVGTVEEIVIATDSRLRFGCTWDCCPKVFPLPRGDAAICFTGGTFYAYPLLLQIRSAVEFHGRSLSRARDLADLKGHLLRVMNDMCGQIEDLPVGQLEPDQPDAYFLLGGYSWKLRRFVIWILYFDAHLKKFTFRPTRKWRGVKGKRVFAMVGDSVDEAKKRLVALLRSKGKLTTGGFDMEPFEVLRDMIRERVDPTIGGPPQVVKVYRHLNATPYGVYWPRRKAGKVTLFGRPLLKYERIRSLVLDPDDLQAHSTWRYESDEEPSG
jgi:hypothetical protein